MEISHALRKSIRKTNILLFVSNLAVLGYLYCFVRIWESFDWPLKTFSWIVWVVLAAQICYEIIEALYIGRKIRDDTEAFNAREIAISQKSFSFETSLAVKAFDQILDRIGRKNQINLFIHRYDEDLASSLGLDNFRAVNVNLNFLVRTPITQMEGILAHEVGHCYFAHNTSTVLPEAASKIFGLFGLIFQIIPAIFVLLNNRLVESYERKPSKIKLLVYYPLNLLSDISELIVNSVGILALCIGAPCKMIKLFQTRQNEFLSDAFASDLGYADGLYEYFHNCHDREPNNFAGSILEMTKPHPLNQRRAYSIFKFTIEKRNPNKLRRNSNLLSVLMIGTLMTAWLVVALRNQESLIPFTFLAICLYGIGFLFGQDSLYHQAGKVKSLLFVGLLDLSIGFFSGLYGSWLLIGQVNLEVYPILFFLIWAIKPVFAGLARITRSETLTALSNLSTQLATMFIIILILKLIFARV